MLFHASLGGLNRENADTHDNHDMIGLTEQIFIMLLGTGQYTVRWCDNNPSLYYLMKNVFLCNREF